MAGVHLCQRRQQLTILATHPEYVNRTLVYSHFRSLSFSAAVFNTILVSLVSDSFSGVKHVLSKLLHWGSSEHIWILWLTWLTEISLGAECCQAFGLNWENRPFRFSFVCRHVSSSNQCPDSLMNIWKWREKQVLFGSFIEEHFSSCPTVPLNQDCCTEGAV